MAVLPGRVNTYLNASPLMERTAWASATQSGPWTGTVIPHNRTMHLETSGAIAMKFVLCLAKALVFKAQNFPGLDQMLLLSSCPDGNGRIFKKKKEKAS